MNQLLSGSYQLESERKAVTETKARFRVSIGVTNQTEGTQVSCGLPLQCGGIPTLTKPPRAGRRLEAKKIWQLPSTFQELLKLVKGRGNGCSLRGGAWKVKLHSQKISLQSEQHRGPICYPALISCLL